MKSSSFISRSRHLSSKIIAVKSHLRISGSNVRVIESKACFGNNRKQNPSPCRPRQKFHLLGRGRQTSRPARPARCIAEDLLMSRTNNVSMPTEVGVSWAGSPSPGDKSTAPGFSGDVSPFFALPSINNIFDARDGNRGFRNVCREDAFPGTVWRAQKDFRLL